MVKSHVRHFGTARSIPELRARLDGPSRRGRPRPGVHVIEERIGDYLEVEWPDGEVRLGAGVVQVIDRSEAYDLEIGVGIDYDRGRAVAEYVTFRQRPGGRPVESARVQSEAMGSWVREAIRALAQAATGGPLPPRGPALLAAGVRGEAKHALVAQAYRSAPKGQRQEAVRRATGAASVGAARQLIRRARAAGFDLTA